jgi:hypothetical protein
VVGCGTGTWRRRVSRAPPPRPRRAAHSSLTPATSTSTPPQVPADPARKGAGLVLKYVVDGGAEALPSGSSPQQAGFEAAMALAQVGRGAGGEGKGEAVLWHVGEACGRDYLRVFPGPHGPASRPMFPRAAAPSSPLRPLIFPPPPVPVRQDAPHRRVGRRVAAAGEEGAPPRLRGSNGRTAAPAAAHPRTTPGV